MAISAKSLEEQPQFGGHRTVAEILEELRKIRATPLEQHQKQWNQLMIKKYEDNNVDTCDFPGLNNFVFARLPKDE